MADRFPGEQPRFDQPVVDQSGRVTQAWANYFLRLASVQSSDDLRALYEALAARVAALEDGESADFQILGQGSVSVNGVPQPGNVVVITLAGDIASPGNTQYYGTGPTGTKGWFPVSGTITVAAGELTKTVGADGVTTFGLANVSDSGIGTLLATTFDAKGRKTGTRPATITGTAQQINVANGTAAAGLPTLSLASEVISSLGKADSALQPGAGHNTALSGLQGGSSTERYHATAAQNSSLAVLAVSGYIDGMQMGYVSGSSLSFSSGSMAIQSSGLILQFPTTITKSGISLGANSWGHCYGFSNAGVPDVEVVSAAPSSPYIGTARSKTGDPTRRYIGSVRTDGSGAIIPFGHKVQGGEIKYRNSVAANQILNNGMASTATNVDASTRLPVTSTLIEVFAETGPGDVAFISNPDVNADPIAGVLFFLRASQQIYGTLETSSTQQLNYALTPAVSGLSIYCCGYTYAR